MIYNCVRCGYETKHKGHFLNHLHRKKICKSILEDISIEDIKIHYNLENSNTSKITSNNSNFLNYPSKKLKKTQKNVVNKQCSYCCKEFSRIDNLNRHLKKCKIKKENEKETNKSEKNKIEILEKHNTELLKAVEKLLIECSNNNKTTNNNNNHHNTNSNNTFHNTININNYGEDTKYITQQFIVDLLKNKPFKAIPEMIKHTYFNKEHPENQNIRITNKKEHYVKIMKDNKWELQDRKNTITDLIDKQHIKISDEKVEKKIDHQCTSQEKIKLFKTFLKSFIFV